MIRVTDTKVENGPVETKSRAIDQRLGRNPGHAQNKELLLMVLLGYADTFLR